MLPPLPKLLDIRGVSSVIELARRVYSWAAPAQDLLSALRRDSEDLEDRVFDLEETSASGSGVTDHGALTGLADDDHTQYLKTNGNRALTGDQSAGGNKITNLAASTANGDAVRHQDSRLSDDRTASGIRTASTVVSVSGAAAPSSGQVLTASGSTAASWVTPTANSVWSPDVPPLSPHSCDDEFTAGSLDAKWTEWDPGAYMTVGVDTDYQAVTLTGTGNASTRYAGIGQAIPNSQFVAYAKVGIIGIASDARVGIFVAEDIVTGPTTADFRVIELTSAATISNAHAIFSRTFGAYNGVASASVNAGNNSYGGYYLRVRCSATAYFADFSEDGKSWVQLSSVTLGFTPAYFGISFASITNLVSMTAYVDFFRVFSGASTAGMTDTKIGRFL